MVSKKDILLTTNGRPLRGDIPALTTFANEGVTVVFLRTVDAFVAARAVCLELVPDREIFHGQWR
ncbi:MAG: hypothetical protein AB7E47_14315 [Desulfovibrionaceae bacterium]